MSGRWLCAVLVTIVMATAMIPPCAAWIVNRRRVDRASADVHALVGLLIRTELPGRSEMHGARLLCGPGKMPAADAKPSAEIPCDHLAQVLPSITVPTDPWGNCYVVSLSAQGATPPALWVLSAGPNGIFDTPFPVTNDAVVARDDIAARAWK